MREGVSMRDNGVTKRIWLQFIKVYALLLITGIIYYLRG